MLQYEDLKTYLDTLVQHHGSTVPTLTILQKGDKHFSIRFAGYYFHAQRHICIMQWILQDSAQTYSTLRHEFAHHLAFEEDPTAQAHGKLFKRYLQAVSGELWLYDRGWTRTPALDKTLKEIKHSSRSNSKHKVVAESESGG